MSFLIAVKIFADLCLYFGIAGGAAPWLGGTDMFLLWPALLCAAGVWLGAMGETRPILRYAGLVPPLASLLLAESLLDFVLLAPALIYTVLVLLMGRFELNRDAYQTFFFRSLWAAGFLGALLLTYSTSSWLNTVLFLGLYLLLGFFLLLQLRLTREGWGTRSLNMLSLLSAIAIGGGLCLVVWLLLKLSGPMWNLIGSAFYYVLYAVVYVVVFLAKLFPSLGVKGPSKFEMPEMTMGTDPMTEQLKDAQNPMADRIWLIIGIVSAVIIIVLVIWRMTRTTSKSKAVTERAHSTERIDVPRETAHGLFSTNRDKVRRSYRKFMQLLLDRGAVLKQSDTTAEIHTTAEFLADPAPARQLRQLYLTARYDEETEVTGQQVREAKELVRSIRRDPELFQ